jgi:hypothetical protein
MSHILLYLLLSYLSFREREREKRREERASYIITICSSSSLGCITPLMASKKLLVMRGV